MPALAKETAGCNQLSLLEQRRPERKEKGGQIIKKEVLSFPLLHPSRQRLLLIVGWRQELRNVVCKETIPASQSRV